MKVIEGNLVNLAINEEDKCMWLTIEELSPVNKIESMRVKLLFFNGISKSDIKNYSDLVEKKGYLKCVVESYLNPDNTIATANAYYTRLNHLV